MSSNKVIYQTVCSLDVAQFVRLTEGNLKLKQILKTVLNRSGCGVMDADGGFLNGGFKELKEAEGQRACKDGRENPALVCVKK